MQKDHFNRLQAWHKYLVQKSVIKFLVLILLGCFEGPFLLCQNLVPNHSFENYDECPFPVDMDGPMPCIPWISTSSCNYFNVCNPGPAGVPVNFRGFQFPHTGNAYIGAYQNNDLNQGNEFPQVELIEELVEGQCYQVSFYTSCANVSCPIDWIGAALTHELGGFPGNYHPQIDIEHEFYSDTNQWMAITGSMIAMGGEKYLTLGNFHDDDETDNDPACIPPFWSYYYFDDVTVEAVETFPVDVHLGGPYESCFPVILDPQISGATYLWSDGSTGQTLEVTESGTYTVVVTTGPCSGGVGSADVTIFETYTANLGPDTTLCEGDEFTIELNPSLGAYLWQDGSTASSYTISSPGTYTMTMDDGCLITTDAIVVTGMSVPEFDLGPDDILCDGEDYWYLFDAGLGDFIWQDQTTHPYFHVEEAGYYALTVTNMCGTFSDDITLIYDQAPVFDLGPDEMILCEDSLLTFLIDESIGDVLWQDGSTSSSYTITSPGDYALTISNTCGSLEDAVTVTAMDAILIDLDVIPDHPCPGEVFTINLSNLDAEFVWSTGSTDPEIQISTSGLYAVTVTNACGPVTDQVLVNYVPDIYQPDLGNDTLICDGGSLLLNTQQPGASIVWSDMSQGNSLMVTSTGEYAVTVSTSCETYYDTIHITFDDIAPVISLPAQLYLCEGEATIIDPGIQNVTYSWSDGSGLPQLAVTTPGIYSVTVSNNCGSDADTVHVVSAGTAPLAHLGPDTSICSGEFLTIIPQLLNVDQWTWQDGSTDSTFLVTDAGQVVLFVANDCGINADTLEVSVMPGLPPFDLGADTVVCGNESVTLSLQIPGVDLLWPDGSQQDQYMTADSGLVIVQVSNICQTGSDSLVITWFPPLPALDLGPDLRLCPGETITIDPGIENVEYSWHDGSSSPEFITSLPGTVILAIFNACEIGMDTIEIIESNLGPQVELGPDIRGCEGDTITIAAGVSGVQYAWQDGSSQPTYQVFSSGLYHLTVTNSCGTDSDSIQVTITGSAPVTSLGPDTTLCIGQSLILEGQPGNELSYQWHDGTINNSFLVTSSEEVILTESNFCGVDRDTILITVDGMPPVLDLGSDTVLCDGNTLLIKPALNQTWSYLWQDGSMDSTFLVTSSGVFQLMVINECGQASDELQVEFLSPPASFDLGHDTVLCPGELLFLETQVSGNYSWQDGTTSSGYLVGQPGLYGLTVSNDCGHSFDEIEVSVNEDNPEVNTDPFLSICEGETFVLNAEQPFPAQYSWSNGEAVPSIQISTPGTYVVTLITTCLTESYSFEIFPDPACENAGFAFPNVFSPNDDGINDRALLTWSTGVQVIESIGCIYDRWGGLIYKSASVPFEWNGQRMEENVLPGVYVYSIQLTYRSNGVEQSLVLSGDITVIK